MTAEKSKLLKRGYGKSIPIVRTYYEVTYLCKRCGESLIRQKYTDNRLPFDENEKE